MANQQSSHRFANMFGTNGNGRYQETLRRLEDDLDLAGKDHFDAVKNSFNAVVRKVGNGIAKHPEMSLTAALACGVMVGWLIKRTK